MKGRGYGNYIEDILEHINYAEEFIKDMPFEEFIGDKKTILSVTKCIEVVGEAAKHIPDSVREKHPEIPWKDIAGIRDRLVHGYFKVNLEIVWITVKQEFPDLQPMLEKALNDIDSEEKKSKKEAKDFWDPREFDSGDS